MKFTVQELLNAGQHKWKESEVDAVTMRNLKDLCNKLNKLGFTPPRNASSCLRSLADQKRINPSAMGSSHLYGAAVDIADADGKLKAWLKANPNKLVECGLWMESPEYTKTWCHLSIYAPASFNRVFKP
ncbi:MAG: hypothetical protein II238_00580 [Alphaproteobacteria bacterium]|nr:hypothetical protein [Alphaproteobacteria bacterium]